MAIELTDTCQLFGALPRGGGLLDQDFYHIQLMRSVRVVRAEQGRH